MYEGHTLDKQRNKYIWVAYEQTYKYYKLQADSFQMSMFNINTLK